MTPLIPILCSSYALVGEALGCPKSMTGELIDLLVIVSRGHSTPSFIVRRGAPQPSDQNLLKQGPGCFEELDWRPSHGGGGTARWAQANRPHLAASLLPLCSGAFSCLLDPSHRLLHDSNLISFGLLDPYSSLDYSVLVPKYPELHQCWEFIRLVPVALLW